MSFASCPRRGASGLSTMPHGLMDGMSLEDFADLVAFLEGLKDAPVAGGK